MLTHKLLVKISLLFGVSFHFVFFFAFYGPLNRIFDWPFVFAWSAVFLLITLYFVTKWKSYVKGNNIAWIYILLLIVILISFFRSLADIHGIRELKWLLFDSYTGLSLFPVFFFLIGLNSNNFSSINKILLGYCVIAFICSLFFINSVDELSIFLLMPIFYVIVAFPLQSGKYRLLILIISVSLIFISLTHRAGVLRILISYSIVLIYFVILYIKINKGVLYLIVLCILLMPFYFLYQGINGKSVFQSVFGDSSEQYSQEDLKIDTRTFLYSEVLQDLKLNKAFVFGKGIDGGYASDSFHTWNRQVVEVGFLQILLKSGIVGLVVYLGLIFSAVFKAMGSSKSLFFKCLGLLLSGYLLMFFIENVLAFDLLNIVIWLVVGMCHSKELLNLKDKELKFLYMKDRMGKDLNKIPAS